MANSFNQNMESHRILIWNASDDPLIQPRIQLYGYTIEKLDEGKTLWTQTDAQDKKQNNELAEQRVATDNFNLTWHEAEENLKRLKRMGRVAFEGNNLAWDQLSLNTLNLSRFEDWLLNATSVYENLAGHPEWITTLLGFNYTPEKITTEQTKVAEVKTLQQEQRRETGDAQQATKDKWELYNQLKNYCNKLRDIARIEFENDPQLLEKLGIFVRS